MGKRILAYKKSPKEKWCIGYMIDGECSELTKVRNGVIMVANENGYNEGLEYNITMCGVPIFGDVFILSDSPSDFSLALKSSNPEYRRPWAYE